MHRRMATRTNHDQIGPMFGGDLRDRSGGTADHYVAHLNRGLDSLFRELLGLLADRGLDFGLVGVDVATASGCDPLVDVDDHESGAVAQRQLGGYRDSPPRLLGSI